MTLRTDMFRMLYELHFFAFYSVPWYDRVSVATMTKEETYIGDRDRLSRGDGANAE